MRKFNVTVNGISYEVEVEEVGVDSSASVPSVSVPEAPKVQASKPAPATTKGTQMKSPMPGNIIDLKVSNGAKVKKGDVVLLLEAMKMENDITAITDGIINFVVAKGQSVNTGDILAVIS